MQIRPAAVEDAEAVAALHVASWQRAYRGIVADAFLDALQAADRAARWRQWIDQRASTLLLACAEGQTHGFVSFGQLRQSGGAAHEAEIWALYVHPERWRAGVGRALLDAAVRSLVLAGRTRIWVWALEGNARAVAFYQSCGFVPQPERSRRIRLAEQDLGELGFRHDAA